MLHLEHRGRRANAVTALVLLDQVLEELPSDTAARTLRGFVLLRLGRTAQAEADLTLSASAAPQCALTAFYRLLVWTALKRPVKQLKAELDRMVRLSFETWNQRNWNPHRYPEVTTLLERSEFQTLMGQYGR